MELTNAQNASEWPWSKKSAAAAPHDKQTVDLDANLDDRIMALHIVYPHLICMTHISTHR